MHLCRTRDIILRLRNKSWTNHSSKTYFRKIEKIPKKIEDRKQLERFLGYLTYASDFIKDLAKVRKSLQQKTQERSKLDMDF